MRNITEHTFGISDYEKYWTSRKGVGDHKETAIHRAIISLIRKHVPRGLPVLDCGVGPAIYYQALAKHYEMHGIEFSSEAIDLYKFDHSRIVSFDLNNGLPTSTVKFFGMIASMILHHLDDPRVFLRAAHERLDANGTLLVVHPNLIYYKHRLRLLSGRFPKFSTSHRNFIVPKDLREILSECGFSVVETVSKKSRPLPELMAPELFIICKKQ